ncbi:MAG: chromate transporter [Niallia nealsonii]|nr:chromate transporter [Niallia nealsonii]
MTHWHLFLAFFRVGILGYGGGPSSIPLVKNEVVDKYKWMTDDEFSDVLALGNALPGPIATKMAGYIGWQVKGVLGMLNAIIASVVPTILLMIVLLTFLNSFKDKPWVLGMAKAVVPVVGVMLAVLTVDFLKKVNAHFGVKLTIGLLVGSLILLVLLNIHPAIVIGVVIVVSLLSKQEKQEVKEVKAS